MVVKQLAEVAKDSVQFKYDGYGFPTKLNPALVDPFLERVTDCDPLFKFPEKLSVPVPTEPAVEIYPFIGLSVPLTAGQVPSSSLYSTTLAPVFRFPFVADVVGLDTYQLRSVAGKYC